MMTHTVQRLGASYPDVLARVMRDGELVRPRGMTVREVRPLILRIKDPRYSITDRPGLNKALIWMEIAQLLAGEYDAKLMSALSPNAASLMTPHGAYGPRIAVQMPAVVDELVRDPDSRRAVALIARPDDLNMTHGGEREMPCTVAWQFFIRSGRLEMVVNMRSWDLVWGLSNDVPSFTTIQRALAWSLGVAVGEYTHVAGSGHIYERHYDMHTKARRTNQQLESIVPIDADDDTPQQRWQSVVQDAIQALRSARQGRLDAFPEQWCHAGKAWTGKLNLG